MRRRMLVAEILAGLLLFASAALAQGEERHEISVQGTGFFTKDTEGNGISQHSTDTGGFLAGYRFHYLSHENKIIITVDIFIRCTQFTLKHTRIHSVTPICTHV